MWVRKRINAIMVTSIVLLTLSSCGTVGNNQHRSFPRGTFTDTWNDIHPFLAFDKNISNLAAVATRYDFAWSADVNSLPALRSHNPHMFITYYMPLHRDNGTFRDSSLLHSLSYWGATHPDWVLYRCDRLTPAYEFGDPNIPFDFSNPALVSWQIQTYALPASEAGYDGIAVDNLNLENLFGACGMYQHGKWVQRYNGKYDDPQWRMDVLHWTVEMHQALHKLAHPLALIPNLGLGSRLPPSDPLAQRLLDTVDGVLDEGGFTHYGDGLLTPQAWLQAYELIEDVQRRHKPCYIINQTPVLNRSAIQWALSSYLMSKEHASELFISAIQNYGIDAWYREYNAHIGTPLTEMYYAQRVYWRDYTHGLSLVNPDTTSTYQVQLLPTLHYVDLYGNAVSPTVTLPPQSGIVLLRL